MNNKKISPIHPTNSASNSSSNMTLNSPNSGSSRIGSRLSLGGSQIQTRRNSRGSMVSSSGGSSSGSGGSSVTGTSVGSKKKGTGSRKGLCGSDHDSDVDSVTERLRCLEDEDKEESDVEDHHFREPPNFDEIGSYDDYLDHYVTSKDLYYFESDEIARIITTLGFRVPELLNKEDFAKLMTEIRAKRLEKRKDDVNIAYEVTAENIKCPLMQALAEREVRNRTGNMSCIIFVRTYNTKKQEVSAWIDFRVRLQNDDQLWYEFYSGKKKLIPRPSDLCYYNWSTFQIRFNSSENYLVTTDIGAGLQFMNKEDRKLITVNPMARPGDNTECIFIKAPNYEHVILYDHFLRVKA